MRIGPSIRVSITLNRSDMAADPTTRARCRTPPGRRAGRRRAAARRARRGTARPSAGRARGRGARCPGKRWSARARARARRACRPGRSRCRARGRACGLSGSEIDEVAGGEVQADAVLERQVRLVVEVDADVVRRRCSSSSSSAPTPNARCSRSGDVPLAGASIRSRCSVERPTNSTRGRPRDRPTRPVVAVGDRQRHRAPDRQDLGGGLDDQRIERRRRGRSSRRRPARAPTAGDRGRGARAADRARDRLGEEAERRRARRPRSAPAGMISGRKHDDDVRARTPRGRAAAAATSPSLRNSRNRVRDPGRTPSSSAHASKYVALPHEREAQRPPGGRRGVRQAASGRGRGHGRGYDSPLRCPTGRNASPATTQPALRVEHALRYRLAAPLVARRRDVVRPGLRQRRRGRRRARRRVHRARGARRRRRAAVAEAAARELGADDAVTVVADLNDPADARARPRARCSRATAPRVVTCFEVVEHLQTFVPLVEMLAELRRATTRRSCSASRTTRSGRSRTRTTRRCGARARSRSCAGCCPRARVARAAGRAAAARRSCPPTARTARRRPVDVALDGARRASRRTSSPRSARAPASSAPHAAVAQTDLDEQRRWERQREADLAFTPGGDSRATWQTRGSRSGGRTSTTSSAGSDLPSGASPQELPSGERREGRLPRQRPAAVGRRRRRRRARAPARPPPRLRRHRSSSSASRRRRAGATTRSRARTS